MGSYRVEIIGAGGLARGLADAAASVDRDTRDEQRALGDKAELIFAAYALKGRTGRLARGIVARDLGGVVQVEAHARNPLSGFDYVGVTRFGHRVARIVPRTDRGSASVVATGRSRRRGAHAALRIPLGGGVIYRRSVRGFHPAQDWSERAIPQIRAEAKRSAERLGRKVASRI